MNLLNKKRQVLPFINDVIAKLVEMSKDAASLEYNDNEQAVRRLKRDFILMRENEFKNLFKNIDSIREEIITNKYKQKKQRKDDTEKTMVREISQQRKSMETSNDGGEWLQDEPQQE
jgi:hypothetical protein